MAPPPGISPSGVGYVASPFVPMSRAPARTCRGAARQLVVVKCAMEADHDDVDGAGLDNPSVAVLEFLAHRDRPPASPAPASTSCAAAIADVTTSPTAGTPIEASFLSTSATGGEGIVRDEQDPVAPRHARAATALAAPSIAVSASQITPSRSQTATGPWVDIGRSLLRMRRRASLRTVPRDPLCARC